MHEDMITEFRHDALSMKQREIKGCLAEIKMRIKLIQRTENLVSQITIDNIMSEVYRYQEELNNIKDELTDYAKISRMDSEF